MARREGPRTALLRAGFAEPDAAASHLNDLAAATGSSVDAWRDAISPAVTDPDLAVRTLSRIAEADPSRLACCSDAGICESALIVAGSSTGLAEFLLRHPEELEIVTRDLRELPSAEEARRALQQRIEGRTGLDARVALRIGYRAELCRIVAFDLRHENPRAMLHEVSRAFADLATAALDAALEIARGDITSDTPRFGAYPAEQINAVRLGVIAMGKTGARELNVLSDVDVMFVAEPAPESELAGPRATEIGARLASALIKVIQEPAIEPPLWQVDTALRPEGKDGPLTRTRDSFLKYYQRWAKGWEFQALMKARAVAGDLELGNALIEDLQPEVWKSASRENFVQQARAMRERVIEHIPAGDRDREIKLGPGGLRDIEFTVQLLQLVHGQVDESVRVPGTLDAIRALTDGGYISPDDGELFDRHYRTLRVIEHRLQLRRLSRTHLMTDDPDELRAIARAARYPNAKALVDHWREVKIQVRGLHEKVFYRPLLTAVAALPAERFRLGEDEAKARITAIGYRDPAGALAHVRALVNGVSRQAVVMRTLMPVMIEWLAERPHPDQGLLAFRRLSERLEGSSWYLGVLRDSTVTAKRLAQLLGDSAYFAEFIELYPEAVRWLDDDADLHPRSLKAVTDELRHTLARHETRESLASAIRTVRRREVLRLAMGYLLGVTTTEQAATGLTELSAAVLQAGMTAVREFDAADAPPVAIIAMGRFGGGELSFGSDLDVLYVAGPGPDGEEPKLPAATALIRSLTDLLADPRLPLDLDAGLRPEGKKGPLVRSLASYTSYYERWSLGWEAQALLRARYAAGDRDLAKQFLAVADRIRYPQALDQRDLVEIRRIKARVESERMPGGVSPSRHLKLGPGALSDVEWLVQILQLQHGRELPELRTTSTMDALDVAVQEHLVGPIEGETLSAAWRFASRVRSAVFLESNRVRDVLPGDVEQLDAIARMLGYEAGQAAQLENDYLRTVRKSRNVFERRFYGREA